MENNSAEESVVKSAAASHSDLLPAVYEGIYDKHVDVKYLDFQDSKTP